VTHCSNTHATSFIRDLRAQRGALGAICAKEPQFHELVRAEEFLQLSVKFRREAPAAHLQAVFQRLTDFT
jgi:hypothetical protein